jgi:monoamine oxidase
VRISGDDLEVSARRAIVAIPPALIPRIRFDPVLPGDRTLLYHAAPAGTEIKAVAIFESPFWREDGLSGASVAMDTPLEVTLDASPPDGSAGVMAAFAAGEKASAFWRLSEAERRRTYIDILTHRFGGKARDLVEYHDQNWAEEEWTRGCSMAHFPTGVLTRFGRLLREPMGRIHWAGTETAGTSHGTIDGAVRSGERAAREVLEAA